MKRKLSIETSTIIVALIAFTGSFVGSLLEGYHKTKQQQKEFESTLIINAIQTGDSELSKSNLKFLVDAKLLTEEDQILKLNKIVKDSAYIIKRGFYSVGKVFICNKEGSKKYHFSKDCRGISPCSTFISEVPLNEAKATGRELCGWE